MTALHVTMSQTSPREPPGKHALTASEARNPAQLTPIGQLGSTNPPGSPDTPRPRPPLPLVSQVPHLLQPVRTFVNTPPKLNLNSRSPSLVDDYPASLLRQVDNGQHQASLGLSRLTTRPRSQTINPYYNSNLTTNRGGGNTSVDSSCGPPPALQVNNQRVSSLESTQSPGHQFQPAPPNFAPTRGIRVDFAPQSSTDSHPRSGSRRSNRPRQNIWPYQYGYSATPAGRFEDMAGNMHPGGHGVPNATEYTLQGGCYMAMFGCQQRPPPRWNASH